MTEINLLQPERRSRSAERSPTISGTWTIFVLAGLIVAELGLWTTFTVLDSKVNSQVQQKVADIGNIDRKLQSPDPDLFNAIKAQAALASVGTLLNEHRYWTKVWNELARTTLKNAMYFTLNATAETNKFTVVGTVATYQDLGKLMLGLQSSSSFAEVALLSSNPSKGTEPGIEFGISVAFKPSLLLELPVAKSDGGAAGGNNASTSQTNKP